jgi:hypothetical protein
VRGPSSPEGALSGGGPSPGPRHAKRLDACTSTPVLRLRVYRVRQKAMQIPEAFVCRSPARRCDVCAVC